MKRSAPRWVVEATAWAIALVLVAGVLVVATGVVGKRAMASPAAVADTPVVTRLPVAKTAAPKPAPVKKAPVKTRARTGVPVEASLGPPPGPEKDAVPLSFAAPEDRYAFLVGVTRYRKPTHDTIAGAADATYIASLLKASGWPAANIRVITNEQATGAAIRDGLNWLAGKSRPGTFTLFHFSGHVKQEGGHEKLWPYDRKFVPDTDLASVLNHGTGKMWVDIAGCEAGGFFEDLPSSRVLVSTSSRSTQKSYEYPQWGESVWAGLVFDLGLTQGQADADSNGTTTVGEALRYATYYAQAITLHQSPYGRQTPQVAGDPVRGWTLANPPS
ncbi:MAG: metacaspase [Frankiales bacterium]|nr:metacaspase [Frankiales bacterium]